MNDIFFEVFIKVGCLLVAALIGVALYFYAKEL